MAGPLAGRVFVLHDVLGGEVVAVGGVRHLATGGWQDAMDALVSARFGPGPADPDPGDEPVVVRPDVGGEG